MRHENDKALPRTRAEAKEAGSKRYFTGKPCKHGHVAERHTCDGRCVECSRIKALSRYHDNQEASNEKAKEWHRQKYATDDVFRQRCKDYQKEYRSNPDNAEKIRLRQKTRLESRTPEQVEEDREYARLYQLERCRNSPKARIDRSMSGGIYKSITEGSKARRSWESLVGYTAAELMAHLERQFLPGMTWGNYGRGGWHIDHVIPRSAFNYETPEDIDFKRCWALENLQPLWEFDNLSKGAKLDAPFQPSLAIAA